MDWCDGDTGTSAKVIVQGLMGKNLGISEYKGTSSAKSYDPSVAMEMRHMKVRERRAARDKKRTKAQTMMTLANEARLRAEELVLMEEKMFQEKRKREDRLISDHMKQMRAELRERQLVLRESPVPVEPCAVSNAVEQAEEFIKSERRRQNTRGELLRQLEEAQSMEVKNNFRLLHSCFSRWFQVFIEGRGKLSKAATISDWKLLARVWRGWACHCRAKREQQEDARQMQRHRL